MKKKLLFVFGIIIISACMFILGLNWNKGEITEKEAVDIAEKMIEREVDYSFINESTITIKDVYEVKRFLKGVNDGAISVYIDKKTGKVVNIIN